MRIEFQNDKIPETQQKRMGEQSRTHEKKKSGVEYDIRIKSHGYCLVYALVDPSLPPIIMETTVRR